MTVWRVHLANLPEAYTQAANALDGVALTGLTRAGIRLPALPRIRLASILYPGDEEFPARASVLFDAAASHYMTTDGLALLGSGLVGRLISSGFAQIHPGKKPGSPPTQSAGSPIPATEENIRIQLIHPAYPVYPC